MSSDPQQLIALLTSEHTAERVGAVIGVAKSIAERAGLSREEFFRLQNALWDLMDRMKAQGVQ